MKKLKSILCFTFVAILICACFGVMGCKDEEQTKVNGVSTLTGLKQALSNGGNYKLLNDIQSTEALTVAEGKSVVIDLNGKSIVCSNDGPSITNKGNLTMSNGRVYSTNVEAQGRIAIKNEGNFNGEGLYLGSKQSRGNAIRNFNTAVIKNCVLDCCDNYINGVGYAYPIANSDGTMTVENCVYNGSANGVFASDGGKLIVKGGAYILDGERCYYMFYLDEGEITVYNGTFVKSNASKKMAYSEQENLDKLKIEGGVYSYNGESWTKATN